MTAFSDPHDVSAGMVLDNYMSIHAAAEYSGYNVQYFRKLVRKGSIDGIKIGQVWLVSIESLARANVSDLKIRTFAGTARFPSIEAWIYTA